MDTLIAVAVPVFGIVLIGYLSGRFGVLGQESAVALNRYVYYFALPPVLFAFTARAPVATLLNWPFLAAYVSGAAITAGLALIAGRMWFRLRAADLDMHVLTAVSANTAYMGVPLMLAAFGPGGALPAILATFVTTTVLAGGAITVLELLLASGTSRSAIARHVAGTLMGNPLLIAPLLGTAFSIAGLPLPRGIGNLLDLLAASAGPCALFALGLSLVGRPLGGDLPETGWLVILKLIVHPLATYLMAVWVFPMDPLWAKAAIVIAALPTGATVFVIAQHYDAYTQRASTAIVVSTLLSIATIPALLIWLAPLQATVSK